MRDEIAEKYPTLSDDDIVACYRVLETVRDEYEIQVMPDESDHINLAHTLVQQFEIDLDIDTDEVEPK